MVFPQGMKIALPPLVNNIVALLKDSSLAYAIGVVELANVGNRVQRRSPSARPIWITTATIYLVLTTVLTQISGAIEHRLDVEGSGDLVSTSTPSPATTAPRSSRPRA